MPAIKKRTAELIYKNELEIATATTEFQYRQFPELETKYGPKGRAKCLQDVRYHLSYLSEAILSSSPLLFKDYIGWAQQMLAARNIPAKDLIVNINCLKEVLAQRLPIENYIVAAKYLNGAFTQLEAHSEEIQTFIPESSPYKRLADNYLRCLLEGNRNKACRLILEAVENNVKVQDIYLQVFQMVQYEIGRLWQLNQISVAQEHYCTAATQMIMSQLYTVIFDTERNGKKLVATCVAGDLHEIGIRMVADFFEMDGWDTYYLGANTPIDSILKTIRDEKADLLLVSATMTYHVRAIADLITAVRADAQLAHIKIMVGGYPFNAAPELWKTVGADACSTNALQALEVANKLIPIAA
ncbi:cobalamin-dependent protein [Adhaeribacter aquaticus]|uniref:cobalamin-dependent protein n=1 Tax=Adhaeribacter aquaticus TaxID=299567 RepID=UPI0003F8B466|nr:cobalamin-dependent protein [Adhaeribacter aquaticus]